MTAGGQATRPSWGWAVYTGSMPLILGASQSSLSFVDTPWHIWPPPWEMRKQNPQEAGSTHELKAAATQDIRTRAI